MTGNSAEIFSGFEKCAGRGKLLARMSQGAYRVGGKQLSPREMAKVQRGYQRAAQGMPESFVAEIPIMAAEKATKAVTGKKPKIREGVYKYISKPAQDVDTAIGRQLERIPIVGRAFSVEEKIPWGPSSQHIEKTVERSSALGPLTKVKRFAVPLVVAGGMERGVRSALDSRAGADKTASFGDTMNEDEIRKVAQAEHIDRQVREKVASTMLRLHRQNKEHEKQAQALKLIYKQAELGLEAIPQSFEELQDKIASIMGQDMATLEKALELTAGGHSFGVLASGEPVSSPNAQATFQRDVLSE